MTAVLPIEKAAAPAFDVRWRAHLAMLAAASAAILLLFHRDAAHMATIWWTSSTFNHVLLIPPIVGWLVWQRRTELALLEPSAWWPPLVLVAAEPSEAARGSAGVALARHAGLVLMLQGRSPPARRSVSRGLPFRSLSPLPDPAGEELVHAPDVTAKMSMMLLAVTGFPAISRHLHHHADGYFKWPRPAPA